MKLFERMANLAAANLLGASAERRITNRQLSEELEQMALSDPELVGHYAWLRIPEFLVAIAVPRAAKELS